ncbi:MAG: DUF4878 domain-containing protein [Verrucomicrobia bacterium]|nr:DUF4878 domain-containing protein [Verrucomicrobiota bacterium]
MSRICVGLVLVMFAVTMGCTCGGGGNAESTATRMLDAIKANDVEAAMNYMDLKTMYDKITETLKAAQQEVPKFEDWKKEFIEQAKKEAKDNPQKFDYKNLEVKEEGDTATVTVEIKEDDKDWKKQTVTLKKVDGKWMMPFDEMMNLQ